MLVLLTISAAAVGMSVVIGADNGATAEITPEPPEITPEPPEITPEPPEITLEPPEITLESMEAETELLDSGATPAFHPCSICPAQPGFCQIPGNLFKNCFVNPNCFCMWCNGNLNCFDRSH